MRSPPKWRWPVGEGANRSFGGGGEEDSDRVEQQRRLAKFKGRNCLVAVAVLQAGQASLGLAVLSMTELLSEVK